MKSFGNFKNQTIYYRVLIYIFLSYVIFGFIILFCYFLNFLGVSNFKIDTLFSYLSILTMYLFFITIVLLLLDSYVLKKRKKDANEEGAANVEFINSYKISYLEGFLIIFLLAALGFTFSESTIYIGAYVSFISIIVGTFFYYLYYLFIYFFRTAEGPNYLTEFNKLYYKKLLPLFISLPLLIINIYGIVSWNVFNKPTMLSEKRAEACITMEHDIFTPFQWYNIASGPEHNIYYTPKDGSLFGYRCDSNLKYFFKNYWICEDGKWMAKGIYKNSNYNKPDRACK